MKCKHKGCDYSPRGTLMEKLHKMKAHYAKNPSHRPIKKRRSSDKKNKSSATRKKSEKILAKIAELVADYTE